MRPSSSRSCRRRGIRLTPLAPPNSLDQLYTDFDRLPSTVIKQSFVSAPHSCFFAPTWTSLRRKLTAGEFDDQKLKKARKPPKPVVRIVRRERDGKEWDEEEIEGPPPDLKREMDWLINKIGASSSPSSFFRSLFALLKRTRAPACSHRPSRSPCRRRGGARRRARAQAGRAPQRQGARERDGHRVRVLLRRGGGREHGCVLSSPEVPSPSARPSSSPFLSSPRQPS